MSEYPEVEGLKELLPMDFEQTMERMRDRPAALTSGGYSGNGPVRVEGAAETYAEKENGDGGETRISSAESKEYAAIKDGPPFRIYTRLWRGEGKDMPLMEIKAMYSVVAQRIVIYQASEEATVADRSAWVQAR